MKGLEVKMTDKQTSIDRLAELVTDTIIYWNGEKLINKSP